VSLNLAHPVGAWFTVGTGFVCFSFWLRVLD